MFGIFFCSAATGLAYVDVKKLKRTCRAGVGQNWNLMMRFGLLAV
jgi:hypothetical protein